MTQEQAKINEDSLELFKQLPRLNERYEVKENGEFIPNLYWLNEKWYISWFDEDGRVLEIYWAKTIEEVVKLATDWYKSKITI